MIYYFVLGYKKEIDTQYKRHLHPCYLTSYNLKLGGSGFGLQRVKMQIPRKAHYFSGGMNSGFIYFLRKFL